MARRSRSWARFDKARWLRARLGRVEHVFVVVAERLRFTKSDHPALVVARLAGPLAQDA